MTRQKKENMKIQLSTLFMRYINKNGAFDYWLDGPEWFFYSIHYAQNIPVYRVKQFFFREWLPKNYHWVRNFEY